jgi:hypothetical protein
LKQAKEKLMTCSESDFVCVEDGEEIELIEAIEPGSLEWFRKNAPLPLLLQALLEDERIRGDYCGGEYFEDAESAVESEREFWELIFAAEAMAERLQRHHPDDPNAKEMTARLRRLTGCKGNLLPSE